MPTYDSSAYYQKLTKIFDTYPDEGARRAYVSAIVKCFDLNDGNPLDPKEIAETFGFSKNRLHAVGFVLTKSHATEFLVTNAKLPGLSAKDIRDIGIKHCEARFARSPYTRGRSAYWLSLAEWICLLEARGEFVLPSKLHKFAVDHNIKLR